ncbi:MAG: hypothetical protein Tsb0020_34400 [Haliangiales bacterium]
MSLQKDVSILRLLEHLNLSARGWMLVDYWDADRCAIGIATMAEPRRLVYVSTFARAEGRYDYACEAPAGDRLEDFTTLDEREDVDFDTLRQAMESHLR